jgi:EpsI family protein
MQVNLALKRGDDDSPDQVYDQVLMRTYRNTKGESVMLALAWGRQQRQEVKIHRPELCYVAQGFTISTNRPFEPIGSPGPSGRAMVATHPRRVEPVLYWVRIGNTISSSAWNTRLYILSEGLKGRIPDGILVRTSQIVRTTDGVARSHDLQSTFLRELVDALPTEHKALLVPVVSDTLAGLSR